MGGGLPRHPSQLYEAFLEGVILFGILYWAIYWRDALKKPGHVSGLFFLGYGLMRFLMEFFREPDAMMGILTTGQVLCIPMMIGGIWLVYRKKLFK